MPLSEAIVADVSIDHDLDHNVINPLTNRILEAEVWLPAPGTSAANAAALAAAVAAARMVHLRADEEYVINSTAAVPLSGGVLDLNGGVLTVDPAATTPSGGISPTGLFLGGSKGTTKAVTTATAGESTITMTAGHGFTTPGPYYIGDQTNHSPLRDGNQHYEGEWVEVVDITGDTLTLDAPLRQSYTATPVAAAYTMVDGFTIANGLIRATKTDTDRVIGLHARFIDHLRLEAVHFDGQGVGRAGAFLDQCRHPRIVGGSTRWHVDSNVTSAVEGYGINGIGCEDIEAWGVKHYRDRHGTDFGAFGTRPLTRGVKIHDGIARACWSSAFSAHGGALDVRYIDCEAYDSGGGFINRAERGRVIRPRVVGTHNDQTTDVDGNLLSTRFDSYEHAIIIGEADSKAVPTDHWAGLAGIGYQLEAADLDLRDKPAGREIALVFCRDPLISARLHVLNGVGATTSAIRCHGNTNRAVTILVDWIDQTDSFDNWPPIVMAPNKGVASTNPANVKDGTAIAAAPAGATFDGVTVIARINKPRSAAVRAVGGDTTTHSKALRVLNLEVPALGASVGAGEAMISIPAGFVDFIRATDAWSPSTTEASIYSASGATVTKATSSGHSGA